MNIKANLIKSSVGAGLIAILATAYALDPTQVEPVVITPPFIIDDVSEDEATLYTADDKYTVKVQFDSHTFGNRDDFQKWTEIEIQEVKNIEVTDDHGEIEFYMDSLDVIDMKAQIQTELYKKLSGG